MSNKLKQYHVELSASAPPAGATPLEAAVFHVAKACRRGPAPAGVTASFRTRLSKSTPMSDREYAYWCACGEAIRRELAVRAGSPERYRFALYGSKDVHGMVGFLADRLESRSVDVLNVTAAFIRGMRDGDADRLRARVNGLRSS